MTYAGTAPARLAETLNANMILKLADRAWLWRHASLMMLPDASGSSSTTLKTTIASLGGIDRMVPVLETVATTPTSVALTSFSTAVARQALERTITDLNDGVDGVGFNIDTLAGDLVASAHARFTDMIAEAGATFTTSVGSTGVQMTTDDAYDATYALETNSVHGPYLGLLRGAQWTNLRESLRSEGGAVQFAEATPELLKIHGPGFKGMFIGVEWHASDSVPDDATDYSGCVFGQGAIAYRELSITRIRGVGELLMATPIYVTLDYDNQKGEQNTVGNYNVAVSKTQDLMGVTVATGI